MGISNLLNIFDGSGGGGGGDYWEDYGRIRWLSKIRNLCTDLRSTRGEGSVIMELVIIVIHKI